MGYFHPDCPGHEGFAVAYVIREGCDSSSKLYRELAYPLDDRDRSDVRRIGAGCGCGWRSPHWTTAASWIPFSPDISEIDGDRVRELWASHAKAEGGGQ